MPTDTPIVSPDDQRVTFVELFFDLVFVFSVTQVVARLHHLESLASVGATLIVFWLVWWAWTQFTWALNAANTDHPRIQFVTLLATAVAFFMAVAVPLAFGPRSLAFAVPYVVVRGIGLLTYSWVARGNRMQSRAVRIFTLYSLAGLGAVLLGGVLGGTALCVLWGLAVGLDLLAAAVGGQQGGWNLHPEHFVERHGLIVIIALGETLIVAAAGLAVGPHTVIPVVTAVLVVALTCALWWCYFPSARPVFEHALARSADSVRSAMARDAFSIIHFPMLCGVIAIAVATEAALAHPAEPLAFPVRLALAIGGVLFVGGGVLALWRTTGRMAYGPWVLALTAAAGVLLLPPTPWISMAVMVAALSLIGATQPRQVQHIHLEG